MPPLTNPRHERFAQGLAKGLSASAAYAQAGYKPDDGHASRLAGNGKIKARLRELIDRAAHRTEVTKARVLHEYARIAFADKQEFMRKLKAEEEELTEDERAALDFEIVPTRDGGQAVKIKTESKTAALEALAKHLNLFGQWSTGGGLNIIFLGSKPQAQRRTIEAERAEPGPVQIIERGVPQPEMRLEMAVTNWLEKIC